jgi:hypothetical protein
MKRKTRRVPGAAALNSAVIDNATCKPQAIGADHKFCIAAIRDGRLTMAARIRGNLGVKNLGVGFAENSGIDLKRRF